ncbi:hypothetical protein PR048_020486 [Dryococelus australis]|uniref:CCHC-type domain-containing protein n=1 Tax=Dryococelus australis TaxID=614101 RepID=A0ABQ9H6F9_9NEOP|nr:hypothetical protein PR048_020486 [Dryococelus australis]
MRGCSEYPKVVVGDGNVVSLPVTYPGCEQAFCVAVKNISKHCVSFFLALSLGCQRGDFLCHPLGGAGGQCGVVTCAWSAGECVGSFHEYPMLQNFEPLSLLEFTKSVDLMKRSLMCRTDLELIQGLIPCCISVALDMLLECLEQGQSWDQVKSRLWGALCFKRMIQELVQEYVYKFQKQDENMKQQVKRDSDVNSGDVGSARKAKVTCYNCGKVGHYAYDCKLPQKDKWKCFNCGRVEHVAKDEG